MEANNIVSIITAILQTGGLATFFWFFIRGLKKEIQSLNSTIENQKKTLDVMEKRIAETQKISELYKNLIEDLPKQLDNYKSLFTKIRDLKDEVINELEAANREKDSQLQDLNKSHLIKIESLEQIVNKAQQILESQSSRYPKPDVLNIQSARYGAENKYIDVTEKLESKVINGRLDILVGNEIAGDPIWGVVKHIEVDYYYNNQKLKKVTEEGNILTLP